MAFNTKTCPQCSASFDRKPGQSVSQWQKRKFCSVACASKVPRPKRGGRWA